MHILMREQTTAAWEECWVSQVFLSVALHPPLDEHDFIPSAARFHFSSAFATLPNCIVRCLTGLSKIRRTGLVASLGNTTFSLLVGGKCHFVTSSVLWSSLLPESVYRWLRSLLWEQSLQSWSIIRWMVAPCRHSWGDSCPSITKSCYWFEPTHDKSRLFHGRNRSLNSICNDISTRFFLFQ